jgi:hypothetical protein
VTLWSGVAVAVLALPALAFGGPRVALGFVAGGALAVLSFRGLAGRVTALVPGAAPSPWGLLAALRWAGLAAAAAVLLASEAVHPAALLAGTVVLPCAVLALGIRASAGER